MKLMYYEEKLNEELMKEDLLILQEIGREQDLAEWNRIQYSLWLKLVNAGIFDEKDIKSFVKFAAFFYDYFKNNNKVPSVREVKSYLI